MIPKDGNGNLDLPGFVSRCKRVISGNAPSVTGNAPSVNTLKNYLYRGTTPGLDAAAIMALAAGVTLDWLAGIADEGARGAPHVIVNHNMGEPGQHPARLVEDREVEPPTSHFYGYTFTGHNGERMLEIRFEVSGRTEPINIPFGLTPERPPT